MMIIMWWWHQVILESDGDYDQRHHQHPHACHVECTGIPSDLPYLEERVQNFSRAIRVRQNRLAAAQCRQNASSTAESCCLAIGPIEKPRLNYEMKNYFCLFCLIIIFLETSAFWVFLIKLSQLWRKLIFNDLSFSPARWGSWHWM